MCIFLSLTLQELQCAFSTEKWDSLASPPTFPAPALEQCAQGQVFMFLITPFSQWHPLALTWSLGHKDFGERWGNMLRLTWGDPFYTHQWQLPQGLLTLPEFVILWERGAVLQSLVPKTSLFFSFNTGNNQSPYHCCLFKPLNNLMLCLLLVPIQLSPGLCGEILLNALIFLALPPPPPSCVCMMLISCLSFFLLFCIFLSSSPSTFCLWVFGGFFFFSSFLYKD